jgi:L-alanine-DL-glutamate epimerase-like enolase superfamily enzyme
MKITAIHTTPLLVPHVKPYHWAWGVVLGSSVILVEVHTDAGVVGFGESIASPVPEATEAYIRRAGELCIGKSPFANSGLIRTAHQTLFKSVGTGSAPRFSAQVLAGLEMALWDVVGKFLDRPVHELLGGAVREDVAYFGFAQGESASEIAADAFELFKAGFKVIYIKVGRGDELDLEITRKVREAIGPDARLRVDPNEQWTPDHAMRMARRLAAYDVEAIEQPTHCESIRALAQVRSRSPIAVSADQSVFSPFDAFNVCAEKAADLIVVGIHETGGLSQWCKVAHIAEAAGVNICIHGLKQETGITTCASNQVAATIANLDSGNQHMARFLAWDVIKSPDLSPKNGRVHVIKGPGLGFEIDWDNVERAKAAYAESRGPV